MSNLTQQVKQGAEHALTAVSQGWRELKERASGALTHFMSQDDKDQSRPRSTGGWGFMAVDVGEGKDSVVVRVEAPGMNRSDFKIELKDDQTLLVRGEKRFEREFRGQGRYSIQSSSSGCLPGWARLHRSVTRESKEAV